MRAYEAGQAQYFATPPVNLIYAFHASLSAIAKGSPSLEQRFALHREQSSYFKKTCEELGLKQVAKPETSGEGKERRGQANGMTAVRPLPAFISCRTNDTPFLLPPLWFLILIQLYFPDGISAGDLLPRLVKKGIVVAGGLHKDAKGWSDALSTLF